MSDYYKSIRELGTIDPALLSLPATVPSLEDRDSSAVPYIYDASLQYDVGQYSPSFATWMSSIDFSLLPPLGQDLLPSITDEQLPRSSLVPSSHQELSNDPSLASASIQRSPLPSIEQLSQTPSASPSYQGVPNDPFLSTSPSIQTPSPRGTLPEPELIPENPSDHENPQAEPGSVNHDNDTTSPVQSQHLSQTATDSDPNVMGQESFVDPDIAPGRLFEPAITPRACQCQEPNFVLYCTSREPKLNGEKIRCTKSYKGCHLGQDASIWRPKEMFQMKLTMKDDKVYVARDLRAGGKSFSVCICCRAKASWAGIKRKQGKPATSDSVV